MAHLTQGSLTVNSGIRPHTTGYLSLLTAVQVKGLREHARGMVAVK